MRNLFCIIFTLISVTLHAQSYQIRGVVSNKGEALSYINVQVLGTKIGASTLDGQFNLLSPKGRLTLSIKGLGYKSALLDMNLQQDTLLYIDLENDLEQLNTVTIVGSNQAKYRKQAMSLVGANGLQIESKMSGSLMKSLDHLPGVGAIEIGQGLSKPVIRGLSFNRVAVSELGIKQQGQQWGADHGLEIDQFNVEQVDIVKGPMSLQYGSDAIGGIVLIKPFQLQPTDGFQADLNLNAKTNNQLVGGSIGLGYQKNKDFVRIRATIQDFADYKVPADSFSYLGYRLPIYNGVLKNTAGKERDLFLSTGTQWNNFDTKLSISNVYAKMGFFAGAHGYPSEKKLVDDGNKRNVDLPFQSVNHLKLISNSILRHKTTDWHLDLAYQANLRKEYAQPHTHGTRPLPDNSLELKLDLQTFSLQMFAETKKNNHVLTYGVNTENQRNRIGGYSFLLPEFDQISAGAFFVDKWTFNEQLIMVSGLRFDWGQLQTQQFVDPYIGTNFIRSAGINQQFSDFSFGIGLHYQLNSLLGTRAHLGKSFRLPTANEMGSNGIHHGTFRYEIGDPNIQAEVAYQLDLGLDINLDPTALYKSLKLRLSAFNTFFPNFIFLNPTGLYTIKGSNGESILLPDVGQIYHYEQARAQRIGGEAQLLLELNKYWNYESSIDYVYAVDLEKHYALPFTPPLSWNNQLNYTTTIAKMFFTFTLAHKYNAEQLRVRNEDTTPYSHVWDVRISWQNKNKALRVVAQLQNIGNQYYMNHTSYYRNLQLPEIGRNFTLSLHVPLHSKVR